MGIKRVAGLAWNWLLIKVDNSTGKGTSGMDKFSSKFHRVHLKLGGNLLKSLRIKTQFLERLQGVRVTTMRPRGLFERVSCPSFGKEQQCGPNQR